MPDEKCCARMNEQCKSQKRDEYFVPGSSHDEWRATAASSVFVNFISGDLDVIRARLTVKLAAQCWNYVNQE